MPSSNGESWVTADIHGAYRALRQCIERSKFNIEIDRLIVLGDVCDGWPYVDKCIRLLLSIKNCIYIIGNHDLWFLNWVKYGVEEPLWTNQGGLATIGSYGKCRNEVPKSHLDFIQNAHLYLLDEKNRLFVHGGIEKNKPLDKHTATYFVWDRTLLENAYLFAKHNNPKDVYIEEYKEVFCGHTPTLNWGSPTPVNFSNVWGLDTGAGYNGRLTFLNVNTKEYVMSDKVQDLYPGESGR